VHGHHGTSGAAAAAILAEGYKLSRNDYDWLGPGIYFFEEAPKRALDWALVAHTSDPAVLESEISLEDCMDLCDIGWERVLSQCYDELLTRVKDEGLSLPRQSSGAHRLDAAVLDLAAAKLTALGSPVRSIRAAFKEGRAVFPESWIYSKDHIQIAVRDTSVVLNTRLLEEGSIDA
jgi:hypothetical protein